MFGQHFEFAAIPTYIKLYNILNILICNFRIFCISDLVIFGVKMYFGYFLCEN